MVMAMVMAT
jgi:tetrahydromethanopterin S-methyltransferase subunit G